MKRIILIQLFGLCILYCNAQTNARDSLKQLLQKEKTDTGRILILADLSFEYIESKPDTMMLLATQSLELSRRIGFLKGEAISLNRIGNAYNSFGNYSKSMEVLLQALQINEKINNVDGIHRNLGNIGLTYIAQEDYRQALDYYFKAKSLAELVNNKRSVSTVCANISIVYDSLKIYDSARLYSQRSYDIANKINYHRLVGISLLELGHIHFMTGLTNSALEFYRLSVPYNKEANNEKRLSQVFLEIAKIFQKINQKDSVIFYAKQSLLLVQEKGFTREVRNTARFLSYYYRKINADSAFFYQDISRAANDSMFSQQKQGQFQSLAFDEKLRQQEIAAEILKTKEERKHNLQYAAIVVGLISFIILFFLLSRSIIVNEKFIKFFGIVSLLAVFEFINLYIHPYLDTITNHSPFLMLVILICIGALLVPLHHKMENWITNIMVEKNKKIRLAAAKKTIEQLGEKAE